MTMTDSDQQARPPDNPPRGEEWMPYPGAGYYEFSHRGKAHSVKRKINGTSYEGVELATRLNNQGYVLVDIRMDDGRKKTVTMHSGVLRSHVGEPGPGEETLHGPGGPQDNRWPENIRWGTHPQNVAERVAANPAAPKPSKVCPRCQCEHAGPGRRCHECVVILGQAGAALLEEGADLEKAAELLDYPSAVGLFRLAVKYGGLRFVVEPPHTGLSMQSGEGKSALAASVAGQSALVIRHAESPEPWLRSVIKRAKAWLADSDGE